MKRRFRWAPTPSGPLHVGNLFSMLLTWLEARSTHSELLLRIDDLDQTRARNEYVDDIFCVLNDLELDWDLGPKNTSEFLEKFSQGHSQERYRECFEKARASDPDLFFVCDCSRKDLKGFEVYNGHCRNRSLHFKPDGSCVWRVNSQLLEHVQGRKELEAVGDYVLYRKEGLFAYQWVSLIEDLRWRITDIVRGEDLHSSSVVQLATAGRLYAKGLEEFKPFLGVRFVHHPLIFDQSKKLSKSEGAESAKVWLSKKNILFAGFLKWIGWSELLDTEAPSSVQELMALYLREIEKGRRVEFSKTWQLHELLG